MQFIIIPSNHPAYTFAKGNYKGINVIVEQNSGYINATDLCVDSIQDVQCWPKSLSSKRLIEAVKSELESIGNIALPIFMIYDVSEQLNGMYIHKLLFPHMLSWASPKFAISMSKLFMGEDEIAIKKSSNDSIIYKMNCIMTTTGVNFICVCVHPDLILKITGATLGSKGVDMGKYGTYKYPEGNSGYRQNKSTMSGQWYTTHLSFGTLTSDGEWYVTFNIDTETFVAKKINKV
jgi:hypothetical protein